MEHDTPAVAETVVEPSRLERISFYILLATVFLLPLFFVPGVGLSLSKASLLSFSTLAIAILWIIRKLKDNKLTIPTGMFALAAIIVPVAFVISSFFSVSSFSMTFFGTRFEVGTAISIIFAIMLLFFASQLLRTKDRIFAFYIAFFASSTVLALYQIARLFFGADFLSFGQFAQTSSTLIGKWNELGVFFGLVAVLSLISLESLSLNKLFKTIWSVVLVIALFFLSVINFSYVWIVVGIFAFVSLVYVFVVRSKKDKLSGDRSDDVSEGGKGVIDQARPMLKFVSRGSLVVFIVSLLFIFPSIPRGFFSIFPESLRTSVGTSLSKFNVVQLEVSPSWSYTGDMFWATLKSKPVFGVGPSQFTRQWLVNKPDDVNASLFWNSDFLYGIGLIPTYSVTTGVVGILAWIFFVVMFAILGYKHVFLKTRDPFTQYLVISAFLSSAYLWIFQIIYVPSEALFALAFLFTGVFLAALYQEGALPEKTFDYGSNSRLSFISVLCLIVLLIAAVSIGYHVAEKTLAARNYTKSLEAANVRGNLDESEMYLKKALALDPRDEYYRALTDLGVVRMNSILAQTGVNQSELAAQISPVLASALTSAQSAIKADRNDYRNWMTLGRLYEGVMPFGYDQAYESAKSTYEEALKLNPKNPSIVLSLARLEGLNKNLPKAKEVTMQALALKQNYTDGIYYLSQIQVSEGNVKDAIQSVSAIAFLNPNDPTVFFQLGFLQYSDKNYRDAILSLEKAVSLNAQYSNARYFLGLSYSRLGRRTDAIKQFEQIAALNPDNTEVKSILTNLRAGRDAFSTASAADIKPGTRLPVRDNQ